MSLFDKTTDALAASVNMRLLRHNITSANIANADTPGYKAKTVDFEQALSKAIDREGLGRLHSEHQDHFAMGKGALSRARADVYDNPDVEVSQDGNTVDMEREVASLNENSILYKAALQLMNKKLASLRYAVTEGTR